MKKFLLFILLICTSLPVTASWFTSSAKIPEDRNRLGHIFRDRRGHFSEDTPENRAFIESATESPSYRVTIDGFGNELYLRTMPNGLQAWAEVRDGEIRNGGRNLFPLQWVPDNSKQGGHFVLSKFTLYDPEDLRFRGALTINRLIDHNGFICPVSPSHWGSREGVKGVEGHYGKIMELLDPLQKKGSHQILLPLEEVTEEEALQILREVAQGIYVYSAAPLFSLHFNRSLEQYPVLFPHYRKTLIGEAIATLDYWMKSAANGSYFDLDFIYSWEASRKTGYSHLVKNSHDFHEYADALGMPYRSFLDVLEQVRGGFDTQILDEGKITTSCRILSFQNHIWKYGDFISFNPGMKIRINPYKDSDQNHPGFDLLEAVDVQLYPELERILPQMPFLKRYFEMLHLANFFSYYCQTLKESGLIPLLDRDLQKSQVAYRGCPNLFPPLPLSKKDTVEIKLIDFLEQVKAATSFELEQIIALDLEEGGEVFYASMQNYLGEHHEDLFDFSAAVFKRCKEMYCEIKSNIDLFFSSMGVREKLNSPQAHQRFLRRIDRIIEELRLEGAEADLKDTQILRKDIAQWFEDPCAYVFENWSVEFNVANGQFVFISGCQSDCMQIAGGCGFPIHHDIHAEENPDIVQTTPKAITVSFAEMEMEEWEDPREVAAGYLFPPLPGHPLKDSLLELLNAINEEDTAAFDKKKDELWRREWNFCDPMGRFFVHHAAKAKTDHFLSHMISKSADVNQVDRKGWTPLHYAAAFGSIDCIRCLLCHRPDLLEKQGDDGETALFVTIERGQLEALSALLKWGADPDAKLHLGLNPLMWSILSQKEDIAMLLLHHSKVDLLCQDMKGQTALELAIWSRLPHVLKWLLDHLGTGRINRYCNGMTPLHLAAALGWQEGVALLLSHPWVDSDLLTSDGKRWDELRKVGI